MRIVSVTTLVFFGFLAAGCGPSAETESESRPEIALIMKSLANEFFATMAEGAKEHQAANEEAYDLIVNGIKNETDPSRS